MVFTSQSFDPETACNLSASPDHTPNLNSIAHSVPTPNCVKSSVTFICPLSCVTSLYPSPDFCQDYAAGSPPVERYRMKVIGSFIGIHGSSVPFVLSYSNRNCLSRPFCRVSARPMLDGFDITTFSPSSRVFRLSWYIVPFYRLEKAI